jgi:C4-type Zn-finger protein
MILIRKEVKQMSNTAIKEAPVDDKLEKARQVANQINKAKTAEEIATIISQNFSVLGHKVINRMILGQTPENALRLKPE